MVNLDPTEPVGPDAPGLIDALVQSSFMTMAVLNKVGTDHDLSLTQLRVLAILRDRRLRMTVLADYLGLDKSTMTGLVDRAEKRGLLRRVANDTDRRAVDVQLTPAGGELAGLLSGQVARSLGPITGSLTTSEQRRLQVLLTRLIANR
ncbi:MAG: MarR family transcriptional regulator [Nakamurella sp.]